MSNCDECRRGLLKAGVASAAVLLVPGCGGAQNEQGSRDAGGPDEAGGDDASGDGAGDGGGEGGEGGEGDAPAGP